MKIRTEVIHSIEYWDLEIFATEIYGLKDYRFAAVQECNNNSAHMFDIDGRFDEYDMTEVAKIRESLTVCGYQNELLLGMLCMDGHIPAGIYIVNVSW